MTRTLIVPSFGRILGLSALLLGTPASPGAALEYPSNSELGRRLKDLADHQRDRLRLNTLAPSLGRSEVWLVELGKGSDEQRAQRPAFLLVAGLEGNDLAGTVSALTWMEQLTSGVDQPDTIRRLLETTTLYVCPRLNPDAAERYFARPRWEQSGDTRPVDDDHDGLVDEDGPEDLNGDGLITAMRVQDPEGEYLLDPADARLLVKADKAKGEKGAWRLLVEGTDSDRDEQWNEDGIGGVNFNRNFPFDYRFFTPGSGTFPLSEPVTKALADFVIAHPNIGVVFTFGAADNVLKPPKSEPGDKEPLTAISEADLPYLRELGIAWRDALGLKKELDGSSEPGTFSDWMYFHRGRLSLAARAWSPALALALDEKKDEKSPAEPPKTDAQPKDRSADKAKEASPKTADKPVAKPKGDDDKRNSEDRDFLKWIDTNAPLQFVAWKEVQHPDFPRQKVEVGGFAPFARSNPPEARLASLAERHARFLTALAGKLPRIGIRSAEARHLGHSVYELSVQIENTGYLPTALGHGVTTREVHPTRVTVQFEDGSFLSGTKTTQVGPISGSGGMRELRWVVQVKRGKTLKVEVIAMLAGRASAEVELKGGQ